MSAPVMDKSLKSKGTLYWVMEDGETGEIKSFGHADNICTQKGLERYVSGGAGVSGAPAVPTGMKYGSGATAVALTGAGAALVTYISGSNLPFTTAPAGAVNGSAWRVTYICSWAAGVGTTASSISEVVIVNDAATDATSTAANTYHRVLASIGVKTSTDVLTFTWTYDVA